MERKGAIDYLKELLDKDIGTYADSVSIEQPKETRKFQIRIRTKDRNFIKEIASKRNLLVIEDGDSVIIYQ